MNLRFTIKGQFKLEIQVLMFNNKPRTPQGLTTNLGDLIKLKYLMFVWKSK